RRGGGRARPAARATWDVLQLPGIARRSEEVVVGGEAAAELVGRRLADDDRTGGAQPFRYGAVAHGDVIGERARPVRRPDARRVDQVLHPERDAVQRTAVVSP